MIVALLRAWGHARRTGELWTIGHWACPPSVVLDTLAQADIDMIVDVRRCRDRGAVRSFDADEMIAWLGAAAIEYLHLTELAGRRPKQHDVDPMINAGWQNTSFKNYADYTLTAGSRRA